VLNRRAEGATGLGWLKFKSKLCAKKREGAIGTDW